ncbi:heterokaryon incompatibility protein-domain-containing protein [Echria macrotheca]|uniref:Heterokaryon incompatibility protein-domain-containing protein n=1 Tax=Echria macrotheca TaxID=438768 RepID=A0AAJ0F7E8_9PEZI|nr:heterokaryon incompatibility protein-domain-containing protein [Echria macrotheca]
MATPESTSTNLNSSLYSPLPSPRHIRILEIIPLDEPDETDETDEIESWIHCKLHVRSLDEAHGTYDALSYAWGSEVPTVSVMVNDQTILMTTNLSDALHNMVRFTRFVWVDSICINQSNVSERGHQVRLMKDIYQCARQVLVWLGGALGSRSMIELQETVLRQYVAAWYLGGKAWLHRFACDSDMDELRDNATIHRPRHKHAATMVAGTNEARLVEELLSRTWFTRTWVVQEVAVARQVTVVFGYQSLPWSIFVGLCSLAERRKMTAVPALKMVALVKIIRDGEMARTPPPLSTLLFRTWFLNASDPRDKVFSLLGICLGGNDMTQFPDYGMSLATVYAEATRLIMEDSGSLEILAYVSRVKETQSADLPSWVPDWRATPAHAILGRGHRSTDMAAAPAEETPRPFDATLSTVLRLRPRGATPLSITLQGLVVGRITALDRTLWIDRLGPEREERQTFGSRLKDFLVGNTELFEQHHEAPVVWSAGDDEFPPRTDPSGDSSIGCVVFMAYMKTILAGGCFVDRQYVQNEKSLLWQGVRRFWPSYRSRAYFARHPYMSAEYEYRRERHLMMVHAKHTRQNRVLFTTDRHDLGICPSWARVGDAVCLLSGGKVPYVLRETAGGKHRLVGECYLHEAMQGELMGRLNSAGREYVDFEIV